MKLVRRSEPGAQTNPSKNGLNLARGEVHHEQKDSKQGMACPSDWGPPEKFGRGNVEAGSPNPHRMKGKNLKKAHKCRPKVSIQV